MKKILIVDDHIKIRELVRITLEDIGGYQILEAGSDREALALAQEEIPDLILLDIMLSCELDGLDIVKILKDNPKTQGIKIICLTAKGQEEDKRKGHLAGVDDYFVKPFNPSELIRKVESILEAC